MAEGMVGQKKRKKNKKKRKKEKDLTWMAGAIVGQKKKKRQKKKDLTWMAGAMVGQASFFCSRANIRCCPSLHLLSASFFVSFVFLDF